MINEKSDFHKTDEIGVKCEKRYSYEYSMFWECNDGCKCQILEDDVVDLLNEQQATIIELERKLKKYAKIGEEQLKQITDLQDELNECRARPTDERGVVKVEYR